MNRFVTAAVAGVIATASVAATVGTADAGGYWRGGPGYAYGPKYGPGPGWGPPGPGPGAYQRHRGHGDWGGAVAGGAILGLALGTMLAIEPPPPPPPRYAYYPPPPPPQQYYAPQLNQAHVDWCAANYPSYSPETDSYIGYDGYAYVCVGPY